MAVGCAVGSVVGSTVSSIGADEGSATNKFEKKSERWMGQQVNGYDATLLTIIRPQKSVYISETLSPDGTLDFLERCEGFLERRDGFLDGLPRPGKR